MSQSINIATLLALAGVISYFFLNGAAPVQQSEFELFKQTHGLKFDSVFENNYRESIFLANVAKINTHNNNEFRTYDMGVNQFTHMTAEEFSETYLKTIVSKTKTIVESEDIFVGDIDWTTSGAVTGVKNQGSCGSCWAFSSTGALEALSKIAYGTLQSFSEQQLVDCSGSYGNQACNGGLMDNAFKYVRDRGITTEAAYPYRGVLGTCTTNGGAFKISGYTDDAGCTNLANALTSRPVAVAVDASNWSAYRSGVFNNCAAALNHGVLLVGSTDQYWKVKNSWASSWGEAGYIRLARGNTCGICNQPSHPNK